MAVEYASTTNLFFAEMAQAASVNLCISIVTALETPMTANARKKRTLTMVLQ